ncbi:hypothetical protein F7734_52150 [Scytonema sp. UIC 10036]|uniref:hypothetical protein n=1 Tax=Scytonema sp. UIC 10036 TaxID=2304196 RepID=UPI0012DAE887|nr:hypothetical protein [Scytonema sp. UIC 10036]MUH00376.1 hypothetical protein [Scytonema sp. UIC 10036]
MPRKKIASEVDAQEIEETSELVEESISDIESDVTASEPSKKPSKEPKTKKPRVTVPKKEFIMILDGGRSQIKVLVIVDGEVTSTLVLESTICEVDTPPFGEQGAFSMSREKVEVESKQKDLVEHWVVGASAKLQGKEYISMSDGEDNKVKYFPILALGAIASLPNLYDLSTGTNEKNRSLTIKLITLSLANPLQLKEAIKKCKWMRVDGIKYSLTFSKDALNYPEGYGASLYGQGENRTTRPTLFTFDVGFGTACVSEYNNLGRLPKRVAHKPNGGGGVATLIREFAEAIANSDSAKVIKPSQLREILSTAIMEDGKVRAVAPDGRDVGNALEIAIKNWVKDSPLTFALESLGIQARKHPVVLCGGGFAIPPVREIVKDFLVKAGIPKNNLLVPERPEIVSLVEMRKLYLPEQQHIEDIGGSIGDNQQQEQQAA